CLLHQACLRCARRSQHNRNPKSRVSRSGIGYSADFIKWKGTGRGVACFVGDGNYRREADGLPRPTARRVDVRDFRETLVNLAHLHLLLNHFPSVGTVIGLGLFVGSLVTQNDGLKRTSMLVLLLIAVSALPVYFSGNAAFEAIQSRPDVSKQFVAWHQAVAL